MLRYEKNEGTRKKKTENELHSLPTSKWQQQTEKRLVRFLDEFRNLTFCPEWYFSWCCILCTRYTLPPPCLGLKKLEWSAVFFFNEYPWVAPTWQNLWSLSLAVYYWLVTKKTDVKRRSKCHRMNNLQSLRTAGTSLKMLSKHYDGTYSSNQDQRCFVNVMECTGIGFRVCDGVLMIMVPRNSGQNTI